MQIFVSSIDYYSQKILINNIIDAFTYYLKKEEQEKIIKILFFR